MKISYTWLKDFIDINETPQEVAALLTKAGLEVEGVEESERIKGGLKGLVIGKVLTCEKHPGADKLNKTTVDIGHGVISPIVCGAPNVAAGQTVVVATVGAMLYPVSGEPFKISKAKIRGEVSEGMICAEDEIGLGEGHEGIMVLDTDLEPGTPASEYFKLDSDYVFEIGLTPNRGDAASHLGVARDLKALLKRPINTKQIEIPTLSGSKVSVEVADPAACIRYSGTTIEGLEVKESPDWLKERLRTIGLSPINNVVDATNYILHDLGQPLHAFDLAEVKGNKIIVKTVAENTPFVTLDGVERKLKGFDLMICNAEEPMCIAGVFGGAKSGVSEKTTSIFLESACFSPDAVRKTGMAHGLKTDSSFRFERGTDPNMPVYALKKAVNLILEVAGGKVTSEITDIYPAPVSDFEVNTSYSSIQKLAGKAIPAEIIKDILVNLGINVVKENGDELGLSVPAFKTDVQREADIVEEIIRIYGYDNIEIPGRISAGYLADFPHKEPEKIQAAISNLLAASGFNEIITNSLTKPAYAALLKKEETTVNVLNKLSEDLGVMRQSLLFSGLEVANYNLNRKQKDLKFFEFGKTYFKLEGKYKEYQRLAIFIAGGEQAESWATGYKNTSFQSLKQIVVNILNRLGVNKYNSVPANELFLKYGLSFNLKDKPLVVFGPVNDKFLKATDLKQQIWYADFDAELLYRTYSSEVVFEEISKFPEVKRDLSLVLDKQVTYDQINQLVWQREKKLLKNVNVFDIYEGKNLGEGKKSYSLSFILQDNEKTLTDEVIDKTMEKLMQAFEKELGAVIRK